MAPRRRKGCEDMNEKHLLCSSEIIKRLGISLRQLYYWELKGIIQPKHVQMGSRRFKRYSQQDFLHLKNMKEALDRGYTLEAASRRAEEIVADSSEEICTS